MYGIGTGRYLTIVCAVALIIHPVLARGEVIHGKVQDRSGAPVAGATVACIHSMQVATASDLDGLFTIEANRLCDTLVVSHSLYEGTTVSLKSLLGSDTAIITIAEKTFNVESVAVVGRLPIARQAAVARITEMDVYQNPTAQGDPLKAVTTLAASTATTEMANPEFRGSPAGYAEVTLNQVPIENPVRYSQLNNVGLFSLFHPALLNNVWVYPSNPPVSVAKAISGLVDIRTKEHLYSNSSYLSAGFGGVGCIVSRRIKSDETFIQIHANGQGSDLLTAMAPRAYPEVKNFYSGDLGVNLRVKLASRLHMNWYAYGVYDRFRGQSGSMNYFGDVSTDRWRVFNVVNLRHAHLRWGITSINLGFDMNAPHTAMGYLDITEKRRRIYLSAAHRLVLRWMELEGGVSWDDHAYSCGGLVSRHHFLMNVEAPVDSASMRQLHGTVDGFLFANFPFKEKTINASLGAKIIKPTRTSEKLAYNAQAMLRVALGHGHTLLFAGGHYASYSAATLYSPTATLLSSDQANVDYEFRTERFTLRSAVFWKQEELLLERYAANQLEASVEKVPSWGGELSWEHQISPSWSYGTAASAFQKKPTFAYLGAGDRKEWMYFVKSNVQFSHPRIFTLTLSYRMHSGGYVAKVEEGRYIAELEAYVPLAVRAERRKLYQSFDLSINRMWMFKKCSLNLFALANNVLNWPNVREYYYSNDYTEAIPLYLQRRNFYAGMVLMF